ncbi:MAG: glycosyltransferase family 4 protein [Paraburkholderia sp.]|jgi:glycosyltransferase involved in cell wall biosynthesis|uniref:glycosyltransferase family 4 protein n=1 Tax=Burkholderiaceae TaxID=119060 RepID=UPI0010F868B9|nr:glycosyltransferase family 4 protein [Burkholderia sp. 4M9327F10]
MTNTFKSSPDPVIHLVNGFQNPYGGSEQETLHLARLLGTRSEVKLWSSSSRSSPALVEQFGIRPLGLAPGHRPKGGTYVFVGSHWRNRMWPYLGPAPQRLIYVFNTFHPKILTLTSTHPRLLRWPKAEYVFISEFQKRQVGVEGVVHPSPVDIEQFKPGVSVTRSRPVVGRLSRDTADKHDGEDLELYREWSAQGVDVRLQGATTLAGALENEPKIELLAEGATPAADFMRSLDVFYYRTGAHVETFGRVVFEAMACALPVVCHRRGGYADWIRHGENGFLFDSTEEARQIVARLLNDAALRASVGARARETVASMYSKAALDRRAQFFTGQESGAASPYRNRDEEALMVGLQEAKIFES